MKKLATLFVTAAFLLSTQSAVPADGGKALNLDWIAGHWCLEKGDERVEELWWPARAGILMGMSRTTRGEILVSFEYLRIALEGDAATLLAQPEGSNAVQFKRTAGGADWARFENPKHDFPTRIEYRRKGNQLHAEVAGPGAEKAIPFDYVACR